MNATRPITSKPETSAKEKSRSAIGAPGLVLATLGVVFGDIGTSPLYTLQTCFQVTGAHAVGPDIVGIASLLVWALIIVVCVKYVGFIMCVDHDGEGGILALLALAAPQKTRLGGPIALGALTTIVVVGAAMLLGDGIITPAISVISAIEGIDVVSKAFHPFIVPISVVVLVLLFAIQSRGTEKVGRVFGPAMIVWFLTILGLGVASIVQHPTILRALLPTEALRFFVRHGIGSTIILGAVVLAVTGVEALYADMSHFGRSPIVMGWYGIVFPALLASYLGQAARLLSDPDALSNPFFSLAPAPLVLPLVVLATIATVIASQALISGAFTLVEQAIALNLSPRMSVLHTSQSRRGQVFVPGVNIALAIGCIALVLTFQASARLASAYGLAVACTMLATSIAYYVVITRVLKWNRIAATALLTLFVIIDGSFVVTGLPKFIDGAWIPLAISAVISVVAITWLRGRRHVATAVAAQQTPVEEVLEHMKDLVPDATATMVFFTPDPAGVPFIARHKWVRDRAREERIVLLTFAPSPTPYLTHDKRVEVERLSPRITRVCARFGYMEHPRIEPILRACATQGLEIDNEDTSFFYADPKIEQAKSGSFPRWQRKLYMFLARNSRPLPDDLMIPAEQRVELGVTVPM